MPHNYCTTPARQRYKISPGSMGVVAIAFKCLGGENVEPSGWGTPVWVNASHEDAAALLELLNEAGQPTNVTFRMERAL